MLPEKSSSRCALHHVLPSSFSLYLALSPFLWKHARKTTQWRKVKCKVSGAGRGVRRSAACSLARIPSLSGLQDEQRTKQPEMAASEKTCLRPPPTHLISFTQGHQDDDRKWNGQQKTNKQKKKKKKLPHHNSQTLLHGYSDLIHFTAAQMHHKSLWGDIWSPQLC